MPAEDVTLDVMVERCRRALWGTHGILLNKVKDAIDEDAGEVDLLYPLEGITQQSFLGLDDEIVYVWEAAEGTKRLTIQRGMMGTTAAEHTANTVVEHGRFLKPIVADEIVNEVTAWPDTLFQVKAKELDVASDGGAIDLGLRDDRFHHVINVLRSPLRNITNGRWSPVGYRVDRFMPRGDYASGTGIVLTDRSQEARRIRVLYAAPFDVDDNIDGGASLVDDWGLAASMLEIIPFGVCARLLGFREIQRTDTEAVGESRIPEAVPATHHTQTSAAFRRLADARITREAVRLQHRYGFASS